jgi:hypothetical protein
MKCIPKSELVVGAYYNGRCRNALLARWNGSRFIYMRSKFGDTYPESIKHEEDFDGFDCFIPTSVEPNPCIEIPQTI